MAEVIHFSEPVNELNSWSFTATLLKDDGTALTPESLETLTLTLYDLTSGEIINSVDDVDILNTGRGTLDANGQLVVSLESDDNPITDDTVETEEHVALVIGTWNTSKGYMSRELHFTVRNLALVPPPVVP